MYPEDVARHCGAPSSGSHSRMTPSGEWPVASRTLSTDRSPSPLPSLPSLSFSSFRRHGCSSLQKKQRPYTLQRRQLGASHTATLRPLPLPPIPTPKHQHITQRPTRSIVQRCPQGSDETGQTHPLGLLVYVSVTIFRTDLIVPSPRASRRRDTIAIPAATYSVHNISCQTS